MAALIDHHYQKDIDLLERPIWPHLTLINLNHNKLREVPEYLCKLPKLIDLFLSNNQLTRLPAEISLLRELQKI